MKKTALIVHSKHTKNYAYKLAQKYYLTKKISFLEVTRTPTEETLYIRNYSDIIIGIGGGSVIDTAKIIANPKRCIAIPTTASGASVTPYATIWGNKKESIETAKPILKMKYDMNIRLPYTVLISTFFDALSHAIESLWSKDSTFISRYYAIKALKYLNKYLNTKNKLRNKSSVYTLIKAGNYAGKAIAIAKTNIVHAISYPLTIKYGINHGLACGLLLPYIVDITPCFEAYKIFGYSKYKFFNLLRNLYPYSLINLRAINSIYIANLAIEYKKLGNSNFKFNRNLLIYILDKIKKENQ